MKKEESYGKIVYDLSSPSQRVTVVKLMSQLNSSTYIDIFGNEKYTIGTRVYTLSYSREDILAIINTPICKKLIKNSRYIEEVYNKVQSEAGYIY